MIEINEGDSVFDELVEFNVVNSRPVLIEHDRWFYVHSYDGLYTTDATMMWVVFSSRKVMR